jgi:hypothetical protein
VAFGNIDRLVFAGLYRLAPEVLDALKILKPETVIRWHRSGFRAYWRWKSRSHGGRPRKAADVRQLIYEMSVANPSWGAPRIHGELFKLGIDQADHGGKIHGAAEAATVARLEDLSLQSCRCHRVDGPVRRPDDLVSAIIWTSDPAAFAPGASVARRNRTSECRMACPSTDRSLWLERSAAISRSRSRRCIWRGLHPAPCSNGYTGSTDLGTIALAKRLSPWQNGYAERLIGSIRRDCLDHVVVFGERHLRQLLDSYQKYYNEGRTHLSLRKDAPIPREVQTAGRVRPVSILGGLHHQYVRI